MADSTDQNVEHTLTGDVRKHDAFHSRYLEHDRTIIVYLPPGYDEESAERYPVLYLHDGQNVFDRAVPGEPRREAVPTAAERHGVEDPREGQHLQAEHQRGAGGKQHLENRGIAHWPG